MKRLSVVLGLLLFGGSVVLIVMPERIPPTAIDALTETFDGFSFSEVVERALWLTAGMGLLVALLGRATQRSRPLAPITIPDRSEPTRVAPIEGTEFDRNVEWYDVYRDEGPFPQPEREPGLRETLVRTVARVEGTSIEEAKTRIAAGEWTENRRAALLFSTDPELTARERLNTWLRPEAEFRARIAAAVDELDELSATLDGLDRPEKADGTGREGVV